VPKYHEIKPFAGSGFEALRSNSTLYEVNDRLQLPVAVPMKNVSACKELQLGVPRTKCARDGEENHSAGSNPTVRV